MKALKQVEKERQKLQGLQSQYEKSLEKRNQELLQIMNQMDLGTVNGYTLMGALLDIKQKAQNKDPICEIWNKAGKTYARHKKRRSL